MLEIFYLIQFAGCKNTNRMEDVSLKKHLKQLLILQNQEKGVEDEIMQLKDKIYQKIQQKRSQSEVNETTIQSMSTGGSGPFGNLNSQEEPKMNLESRNSRAVESSLDKEQELMRSLKSQNGHFVERNQYRSLIDKNRLNLDDKNLEFASVEDLRSLLKMSNTSNQTRFIDLKIENHGKQTIILL